MWHVSTHPYLVSENIPLRTNAFLILLMPAFFTKNQRFLAEIVPLLRLSESVVKVFVVLFSVFIR